MVVKTFGSAVFGIDAITITIEVNVTAGQNYFLVGLPDNAVKESLQRIESAIKSIGFTMPRTKIIINLAPADIRKSGTAFDLPIAIGILAASSQITNIKLLEKFVLMGELGLEGDIRSVKGSLPIAIQSRKENYEKLFVPKENVEEAAIVNKIDVFGICHLKEMIDFFNKPQTLKPVKIDTREVFADQADEYPLDFKDVKGQENIKRALEISAAGGHNVILIGPPGAGKTMLAKRMPSILPPLSLQEALETTKIYSVAGKLPKHSMLITKRPFRSPHHTISDVALVGGGSNPQPGEISLSHHGVLFLDEIPEFKRIVLEVLRQPMEERTITISRSKISLDFPANFMLVASMNPCPCGFYNHPDKSCNCPDGLIQKYLNKISGPLLDRIDLHVEVTPLKHSELSSSQESESSIDIRQRVILARDIQAERYKNKNIFCNAEMGSKELQKYASLDTVSSNLLKNAMEKFGLSARAYDRIIKVARTIADLAESENIEAIHIAEAIQFRSLDKNNWGRS